MTLRHGVLTATLALVLAACSSPATTPASPSQPATNLPSRAPSAAGVELQVYAAASLKAALAKAAEVYSAANPGVMITASTDSSAALEAKIEQGAPADLFLSADISNPQKLVDAGLASGKLKPFAANLLTVIVPKGNPAGIKSPADLAKAGVKVIAAGEQVPISKYATQLVAKLAQEAGYPTDFASAYAGNIVSREDSVAGIVGKIELGEGDAGIVYVTDAKGKDKLERIEIPAGANIPAAYAGVVIDGPPEQEVAARAFLDWLAGPEGQAVLADFGFLPLTS